MRNTFVVVFFILWSVLTCVVIWRNAEQARTIDALIELNHDKSVYIDSGCRGQYQGTEEMLPEEARRVQ